MKITCLDDLKDEDVKNLTFVEFYSWMVSKHSYSGYLSMSMYKEMFVERCPRYRMDKLVWDLKDSGITYLSGGVEL